MSPAEADEAPLRQARAKKATATATTESSGPVELWRAISGQEQPSEETEPNSTELVPRRLKFSTASRGNSPSPLAENDAAHMQKDPPLAGEVEDERRQENVHSAGRVEGFKTGQEEGYKEGYQEGLREGRRTGEREGYRQGWDKGFAVGKKEGWTSGEDAGFFQGYSEGREAGEKDAQAHASQQQAEAPTSRIDTVRAAYEKGWAAGVAAYQEEHSSKAAAAAGRSIGVQASSRDQSSARASGKDRKVLQAMIKDWAVHMESAADGMLLDAADHLSALQQRIASLSTTVSKLSAAKTPSSVSLEEQLNTCTAALQTGKRRRMQQ